MVDCGKLGRLNHEPLPFRNFELRDRKPADDEELCVNSSAGIFGGGAFEAC